MDSVCVRAPQPLGSFSTTWSMLVAVPRSTCADWGNAPLLSQYEPWLPSLRLLATKPALTELAEAVLPIERLGPPLADATATHPVVAIKPAATAVASSLTRVFCLIRVLV